MAQLSENIGQALPAPGSGLDPGNSEGEKSGSFVKGATAGVLSLCHWAKL